MRGAMGIISMGNENAGKRSKYGKYACCVCGFFFSCRPVYWNCNDKNTAPSVHARQGYTKAVQHTGDIDSHPV